MTVVSSMPGFDFDGWQSIEGAPKSGVDILLFFDCRDQQDDPIVDKAYWAEDLGNWVIACACPSRHSRAQGYYTHWMPLPQPPNG